MIDEKKNIKQFLRKYKIKEINKDAISKIIEVQGYTVIPYNRYRNSDKVSFLISTLGVLDYVNSCCCFTYQDEKYRLVFINEELNDEEALIVLAHEEGHIWHNHIVSESVFGSDIKQEFEANEFAHYLLSYADNEKRMRIRYAFCGLVVIACFISIGLLINGNHNKKVYTENYYRTESGTKYHIEGCVYLKNKKEVKKLSKEEFESGNYEPCAVCIQFEDND